MTPTLEELSDYWQDMLHVRCAHDANSALLQVHVMALTIPTTREGQFARALLDFIKEKLDALYYGKK